MLDAEFERSVKFVLRAEGGYVDNPNDPGGETRYGISKRAHPELDIRNLTEVEARDIYYRDYWIDCGAHLLKFPLSLVLFDCCVNCGKKAAIKLLQRSINAVTGSSWLAEDGKWGQQTELAIQVLDATNQQALPKEFLLQRLQYYRNLGKPQFLKGWTNRILDLQKEIEC